MSNIYENLINTEKFTIVIGVIEETLADHVLESLKPLEAIVLIGKNCPSFSNLVNTAILISPHENVLFCSHKARPTPVDVSKVLYLLKQGYGLVGLFRLGFFGLTKELIRRVGFFDERFLGGTFEDDDFVIRLKEANIAYYESEEIKYIWTPSTWDNSRSYDIFQEKWKINGLTITRLKDEMKYPEYNLGVNNALCNIKTEELFLPWNNTNNIGCKWLSITRKYIKHNISLDKMEDSWVPIHLRNIPPPLETFDHASMIVFLAKWIKPIFYVEFGVRDGHNIKQVAPYCKTVHGIDIIDIRSVISNHPNIEPFKMTTDNYVENVLKNIDPVPQIDMIFIDACHESKQVFKDFEGVFPYVSENGFIILHDTYPYDIFMTAPHLCNDCYQVPFMIKNKYGNSCELITLPFNPGLTIGKKKTNNSIWASK